MNEHTANEASRTHAEACFDIGLIFKSPVATNSGGSRLKLRIVAVDVRGKRALQWETNCIARIQQSWYPDSELVTE